jgi:hypothetical protein
VSASDTPATLSEMQTDFLESLREATGVTATNTIATRYLNRANHHLHSEKWWWAERRGVIRTNPPYVTGTIDIATATSRTAVTGSGTLWTTTNTYGDANAVAGYKMTVGSITNVHIISTVGSATSITLDTPYTGDSDLDDSSYAIYNDEYSLATDFAELKDTRFFDEDREIRLIGSHEFYTTFARNSQRDKPKVATLVEIGPSGSVTLRRRVVLGPAPDDTYLIPYRYYTTHLVTGASGGLWANLTNSDDQPIVPLRWRQAIVTKAKAEWARDRKDDARATEWDNEYAAMILRARSTTGPTDDRPTIKPRVSSYWSHARRPYRSGTGGRLSTGSAFDELRDR